MIKKIILSVLLLFLIIPNSVFASAISAVKVGDKFYENLEDAIANASSGDIITLISDVSLENTLIINKIININLNGNDISAPTKVFEIQGGTLNVSGEGTIRELKPDTGVIMIKGSSNPNDNEYSVVNIGKDVTLEGWSGIFINHNSSKSYGVEVNLDGKINAISDINGGTGTGVYVNGNIKHQSNSPVVNILDNAEIVSNGNGLYIAGYSIFNIGKAYISGKEAGIGIKAGILNIDGASVICDGDDYTPTGGYNNGIKASGTSIQIESNNGYAGNMEINIKDGNFKSKNSNVIYEYIGKGNNSLVNSINITGGNYISSAKKDVFLFSDSFKIKHNDFISGGNYSSNPSQYLKIGYTTSLNNDLYNVIKNTLEEVISSNSTITNNKCLGKILIIPLIILGIVVYFNRTKIFNALKK